MTFQLGDAADFVIVGTGAGGATAARILSEAGYEVVLVEEGAAVEAADRQGALLRSMQASFRSLGTTTTAGTHPIPILQGRCVGGSTAINSGIVWWLPDDVRVEWRERSGLESLVGHGLDEAYEQIERELGITETDVGRLGGNSELMRAGSEALGLKGRPTHRNAKMCRGSSRCLQGCPTGARQSMDVSYVPQAVRQGARLHTRMRVEKVDVRHGRAVGVRGVVLGPDRKETGTFRIHARVAVILAASAVQTPVILRRSGIKGKTGDGFQSHPGAAVVGRFAAPVTMGFGATQGYEVPMRARGYKLESLSLPPEMLAARLPGVGAEWQERLASMGHYAQWCAQVRMRAVGRVRPGAFGEPVVRYEPLESDIARLREALALLSRMMFAAGAVEVYPGIASVPEVLRSASEVRLIEEGPLDSGSYHLVASHLFGTAAAGTNPRASVVGPDLRVHGLESLYVMDASVLPTNLGVNPQHTIMAVVWQAATALARHTRASERRSA